jgi:UDP-N-acetylglucosamine acyltransferase
MIHETAIVHPGAKLGADVQIGPYSIVGEHVEIGDGTNLGAHAVITGHTRVGRGNRVYHHVSLGEVPQDKKYAGESTRLEIGDDNVIREFCTFNIGTVQDRGYTRLGDRNWVMAYVHMAHDTVVGNDVILANCTQLAGHV